MLASPAESELQSSPGAAGGSCSTVPSAFLPKEKELEKQPEQHSGQPQCVQCVLGAPSSAPELPQDVFPEPGVPSPASSPGRVSSCPELQTHTPGVSPSLPDGGFQREAQSITEVKTKPRMSLLLRKPENVFGAF